MKQYFELGSQSLLRAPNIRHTYIQQKSTILTSYDRFKEQRKLKQSQSLKKLNHTLLKKKDWFTKTLSSTFYKMNSTMQKYTHFRQSQKNKQIIQKKKILSLNQMNIRKDNTAQQVKKSTKQVSNRLRISKIGNNKLIQHRASQTKDFQKEYIQAKNRMNAFKLNFTSRKMPNFCYDSIFPISRYGACLTTLDNRIFLHGGYSYNGTSDSLTFHQYRFESNSWKSMQSKGQTPWICPCFHTTQVYKSYILFIGGLAIDCKKGIRYYNTQINAYHLEKQQWIKIRWDHRIRSHASTIYGNNLLVNGGITEKQKVSDKTFIISLNSNNICNPVALQYQDQPDQQIGSGIAYHKLTNTSQFTGTIKAQLKIDGVIRFGGMSSQGKMTNQIKVKRMLTPGTMEYIHASKAWETVIIKGEKPEPRINHSLNIVAKRGICVLIGGQNQNGQVLCDVWVLNLFFAQWSEVKVNPAPLTLMRGISCHSTTVVNSKVFIFGGSLRMDNQTYENFLYIDTGQVKQNGISKLQKKIMIKRQSILAEKSRKRLI